MDLSDLRGYIENQKLRLQQERKALDSQKLLPIGKAPLEELGVSGFSEKTDEVGTECNPEQFTSQLSDALSQRIDSLNSLKHKFSYQLENTEDHRNNLTSKNHKDEPNRVGLENVGAKELLTSGNQHKTSVSEEIGLTPGHIGNTFSRSNSAVKTTLQDDIAQNTFLGSKVHQYQITSASCNRQKEVERLQEKLASVSFWDDFGQSATSKKWSSNASDTMVRIGEFSPANPDLQAPGKTLLGLGEYEERRRQLLEKKKQEYKDYLALNRNHIQRTDHQGRLPVTSHSDILLSPHDGTLKGVQVDPTLSAVDASTQTDEYLVDQHEVTTTTASKSQSIPALLPAAGPVMQPPSPREKLNMELQHHCAPCFVSRAHTSQTTEQLPDARMRQLLLQEELRLQIEDKRRLEAERREQERIEDEALQKRVAEQQARLRAEYERDEKLRREREIQKQQQIEEFQKRQEELKAEAKALKQEERRQRLEAAEPFFQREPHHSVSKVLKGSQNAHLVPPPEPSPLSILKSPSPPLHSPKLNVEQSRHLNNGPPSPRALIKVLEGPTLPNRVRCPEDSLPIPLMPVAHTPATSLPPQRSSCLGPLVSPRWSPRCSPDQTPDSSDLSPTRFVAEQKRPNNQVLSHGNHHFNVQEPSEAMRNLEERWKVPAVQKNVCARRKTYAKDSTGNVLTQLGAFRRQLQLEHMRMEETVRQKHKSDHYHQKHYQQHIT